VANHNPNLAKINRNYTVSEVATLYGISKATVRRWIRLGLPVIDDMRPILILGCDLLDYIHRQRRKNKKRCGSTEMYCCKCREPRRPALDLVTYIPNTAGRGRIMGLCSVCEVTMYKFISLAVAEALQSEFEIQFRKS